MSEYLNEVDRLIAEADEIIKKKPRKPGRRSNKAQPNFDTHAEELADDADRYATILTKEPDNYLAKARLREILDRLYKDENLGMEDYHRLLEEYSL